MGVLLSLARGGVAATIVTVSTLVLAPAALADTTNSTNWAGYAVHGTNVGYQSIAGSWREPSATCTPGANTYSSYWVGLGGYSVTSQALEQIGTEVDCSAGGAITSTAWYELVPAPAADVSLTVRPGDVMNAAVAVNGKRVTLTLDDVTRKRAFTKTLSTAPIDVTSAEWIVEAPSECVGQSACQILPLANFGAASFTGASVISTTGRKGGIQNPAWQTTAIKLTPTLHRYFTSNGASVPVGVATPSSVGADDHSFKVSYSTATAPATQQPGARVSSARPADVRRTAP